MSSNDWRGEIGDLRQVTTDQAAALRGLRAEVEALKATPAPVHGGNVSRARADLTTAQMVVTFAKSYIVGGGHETDYSLTLKIKYTRNSNRKWRLNL